ncbi:MAG: RNA-dependent RNA polymerase [Sanya Ischnura senegalensis xinmovirus 1]|uniref:RNA-directed RNA polymerase n=1 Tax=Sanya Ischnura senegalensis xinmovirus 1 TaxID=2905558 RepID=A0A8K1XGX8_9MONO|nr:MAG: RNA-dependent RNA polymerase [Sanya Ischnura senegalensis xinmovirus 1]
MEIDGHLNSPITNTELNFLLRYDKFFCFRHRSIKTYLSSQKITQLSSNLCSSCWRCITSSVESHNEDNRRDLSRFLRAAISVWLIQKAQYIQEKTIYTKEYISQLVDSMTLDSHLIQAFNSKKSAEKFKDFLTRQKFHYGEFKDFWNFQVEKEVTIFNCRTHGKGLVPTNLLVGALDNLQAEYNVIFHTKLKDVLNINIPHRTPSLLNYLDSCKELQTKLGESFFDILKCQEALIVGHIISRSIDLGCTGLKATALEGMIKVFSEIQSTKYYKLITPRINSITDEFWLLELAGLTKIFGHPTIDLESGLMTLRAHALANVPINHNLAQEIAIYFTYAFTKQFYKKQAKWPEVEILPGCVKEIEQARNQNRWLTHREDENLNILEWRNVKLLRNFDYCTQPDMTELLKDSSLAPQRHLWTTSYDHCAFKHLYGQDKPRLSEIPGRRTILEYLRSTPEFPIQIYMRQQELPNNPYATFVDDVMVVCPKERELKKEGRHFCKQTYGTRLNQVTQEFNLKVSILPYLMEITMAFSELKMSKRVLAISSFLQQDGCEVMIFDFVKWCMSQRGGAQFYLARILEELFDAPNTYTDAHPSFCRSAVLVNDRLCPPKIGENGDPLPGQYCHYGQLGGFEGMRQKMWTIFTVLLIYRRARLNNIKIQQLGQGDNQVILIKWSEHQIRDRVRLREQFLDDLLNDLRQVNLEIKPTETFYSGRYFEYGKVRYLDGVACPNTLKKVARLIPDINDGIKSIQVSLTTLGTCTESVAKVDWSPDVSFIQYCFETLVLLSRESFFAMDNELSTMIACLFWTSSLGGLPLSSFPNHAVRGISDRLTESISMVQSLKSLDPPAYTKLTHLVNLNPLGDVKWSALIMDIFTLNIKTLPSAEGFIREHVHKTIQTYTTNEDVLSLYNEGNIPIDDLISQLLNIHPLYVPLIHELFRNSNAGLFLSLKGRFCKERTLVSLGNEMLQREVGESFSSKCRQKDKWLVLEFQNRLSKPQANLIMREFFAVEGCSMDISFRLREFTYGEKIYGVTHPVPWEQVSIHSWDLLDDEHRLRSIRVELSEHLVKGGFGYRIVKGPCSEYLGSETSRKVKKGTIDLLGHNSMHKAIMALAVIYSWAVRLNSVDLQRMVMIFLKEKERFIPPGLSLTDVQEWLPKNFGGHMMHRFQCILEDTGSFPNCLTTMASHIAFSTSNMGEITKGGDDFSVFFQLNFNYIISFFSTITFSCKWKLERMYGAYFGCILCTSRLPNLEFTTTGGTIELGKIDWFDGMEINIGIPDIGGRDLIQQLSVYHGFTIARSILEAHLTHQSEILNLSLNTKTMAKTDLNYYDFRGCNLYYVLVGMVRRNSEVKKSYTSSIQGKAQDVISPAILQSLSSALLVTDRLNEFLALADVSILKHNEATTGAGANHLVYRAMCSIFSKHPIQIVYDVWRCEKCPDEEASVRLVSWTLKTVSRWIMLGLPPKVLKPVERSKYKLRISSCIRNMIRSKDLFYELNNIMGELGMEKFPPQNELKPEELVVYEWRKRGKQSYDQELLTPDAFVSSRVCCQLSFPSQILHHEGMFSNETPHPPNRLSSDIHHLARQVGKVASSASKIALILADLPRHQDAIVCLAEGSGSILFYLMHIFPHSQFYFNTLGWQEVDPKIEINNAGPVSCNASHCPMVRNSNINTYLAEGESDISTDLWHTKLRKVFDQDPNITLVTMDAQSVFGDGNQTIILKLIRTLRKLSWFPTCLFKLYSVPVLRSIVQSVFNEGLFCRPYKPYNSNLFNEEIFIQIRNEDFPGSIKLVGKEIKSLSPNLSLSHYIERLREAEEYLDSSTSWCSCLSITDDCVNYYGGLFSSKLISWNSFIKILFKLTNSSWELISTIGGPDTAQSVHKWGKRGLQDIYVKLLFTIYCLMNCTWENMLEVLRVLWTQNFEYTLKLNARKEVVSVADCKWKFCQFGFSQDDSAIVDDISEFVKYLLKDLPRSIRAHKGRPIIALLALVELKEVSKRQLPQIKRVLIEFHELYPLLPGFIPF